MTFTTIAAPRAYAGSPRRGPVTRLLEDERWLAILLLLPTVLLLGLFIAYPFVKGVELAVTDTKVGVPGHFVGLDNFRNIWSDKKGLIITQGRINVRAERLIHGDGSGSGQNE